MTQHGTTVSFFKGLRITFPHKKNANSASETTTHDGSSCVGVGGRTLVVAMGDCIPVRPFNSYIECLAEIRMIWRDKTEDCVLLSLRLFFLPENTPKGRDDHGEVSERSFYYCRVFWEKFSEFFLDDYIHIVALTQRHSSLHSRLLTLFLYTSMRFIEM